MNSRNWDLVIFELITNFVPAVAVKQKLNWILLEIIIN